MRTSHACPGNVARAEDDGLAIEGRLRLSFTEEVRLFERMIMRTRRSIQVVLHHEHRGELSTKIRVDHHLHIDSPVDKQCGTHARGDFEHVLALFRRVHLRGRDLAEVAIPGIAYVYIAR